jgi:poly(3-hydroxybutyrate) depolymerase
MYEPTVRGVPNLAFLWPAFAAAATSEMAALFAKQCAHFAVGQQNDAAAGEPEWATPHRIALELKSARLHDFATDGEGPATLLCAPYALHGAVIADLAPSHSLVGALRDSGLRRLFVADWRSATEDMRFLGIDDYLADLNVLVDEVGAPADLVGVCQGGWLALIYAARFPAKVRKLVLAGAPVDTKAAPSALTALAGDSPLQVFEELVRLGDGLVPGRDVLKFWGPQIISAEDIRELLHIEAAIGSPAFAGVEARFREWYAWILDLPGSYFIEVVERLYKRNELAAGGFRALGHTIDLAAVHAPAFLLAARDDELVAPAQLFAAAHLVGTPARQVHTAIAPCRHLGLFMDKAVLNETWPKIAAWLNGT